MCAQEHNLNEHLLLCLTKFRFHPNTYERVLSFERFQGALNFGHRSSGRHPFILPQFEFSGFNQTTTELSKKKLDLRGKITPEHLRIRSSRTDRENRQTLPEKSNSGQLN
jgi:hypothetical protein